MAEHKDIAIEGTVYFWFAVNDTGGSAIDGSTPLFDVRLCGTAADAAPVHSGSATLLTHASYPDGSHEIAIAATAVNGFAAGNTYGVFATVTADGENPAGFVGSFCVTAAASTLHDGANRLLLALPAAAPDGAGGLPISDAGELDLDAALAHLDGDITSREADGAAAASQAALEAYGDGNWATAVGFALASAWTAELAALLNTLAGHDPGGTLATSAEVTAIQNNTRCVRVVPSVIERPDSGSTAYRIELLLYDEIGNMEVPDAAPTIGVVNQAGTSRDANLDATTMTLVSTGRYRSTYTVASDHAIEQLIVAFSVIEGGNTRVFANPAQVVDTTAVDFTAADRTKLDALHDTRLTVDRAGYLDKLNVTGTLANSDAAATYKADVSALALEATVGALNNLSSADVTAAVPTAAAIAEAVQIAPTTDYEDSAPANSLAAAVAVITQQHETTFTDDEDDTGTVSLKKSDDTEWFAMDVNITDPTESTPPVITGVNKSVS